jgi:polyhydroxyalkanoate synthesis repressor PhaR
MVRDGVEFTVVDARTGQDLTRSVLTQIIMEAENRGPNLLPVNFLRQLIAFYGDSLQGLLQNYLDHTMQAFTHNQEQMRRHMSEAMNGMFPFAPWDDIAKQNLALFERAAEMWSSLRPESQKQGAAKAAANGPAAKGAEPPAAAPGDDPLGALKDQIEALRARVDALSRRGG